MVMHYRYYKKRQNLWQSVTCIAKCDKKLLQSATVITKWDITPDLAVVVNNSQLWIVMLRQS